ncbi:MAG: hypothetical protein O3B70_01390 [Bacteroidetes bacterium]|nr:hypothetical protein [Bacteroidota bacterium]MDA0902963.1 hypothetical protein [Bacteroidota bacterium]MDA1241621.1 hypothetical protein [Bacteroidota bacterium]
MSDSPSFAEKTALAAERFWLVMSVVATGYVVWVWMSEASPRWVQGLFPCISWLWWMVRRTFRKRMASTPND